MSRFSTVILLAIAWCAPAIAQQPLPLDQELVVNGDFENLNLNGWTVTRGSLTPIVYSGGVFPTAAVAQAINGGRYLVRGMTWDGNGNASMEQRFDASGNAVEIDNGELMIELGGFFGGVGSDTDFCIFRAIFFDAAMREIPPLGRLPDIGRTARNYETTLLWSGGEFAIPPRTRTIQLEFFSVIQSGSSMEGVADNLSAKLRRADRPRTPLPLDTELLDRGGFEDPRITNPAARTGWRGVSGLFAVAAYGDGSWPSAATGQTIGGGRYMLSGTSWDGNGHARLSQSFDLRGHENRIDADSLWLRLGGWFGGVGSESDYAFVEATYLDAGGSTTGTSRVGTIGRTDRNWQTLLLPRSGEFRIPKGTRAMTVTVWLLVTSGSTMEAVADNLSAVLLAQPTPMPTPPIGAELLEDPGFALPTIVDPASRTGWRVVTGLFELADYGAGSWPSTAIGQAVGGGRTMLRGTSWDGNGWARLRQSFDVTGHAGRIDAGNLWLRSGGFFGGVGAETDYARLDADCFDFSGTSLGAFTAGPVDRTPRNSETTLLSRVREVRIPPGTRRVDITVMLLVASGSTMEAVADNVSAMLLDQPTVPAPLPLDTELLDLAGFESLTLTNPVARFGTGWEGAGGRLETVLYGADPRVPSVAAASQLGGGQLVLRATTQANPSYLRQTFDLRGNAADIDAGRLAVAASGWFGGYGAERDYARLQIVSFDAGGGQLRADEIGPVGNNQRGNVTRLLQRRGEFLVPPLTRTLIAQVRTDWFDGNENDGLADSLSVKLVRPQACGSQQCIHVSSSDPVWAFPVTGALAAQIATLNAPPPAFNAATWSPVFRKNENHNPALKRSFLCTNPSIIPLNEAFVDARDHLLDADEVTLDNCGSAFYRFTFDLPSGFATATLYGVANADDQAAVFLNGTRISGEMSETDFGNDRLDSIGRRILTWPTRDVFFTDDVLRFRPGLNELVFAVCGDASQFEPTGIEFEARVLVDADARLTIDRPTLSAVLGGTANLMVDAGPGFGGRPYFLVGSIGGMWPGMDVQGYTLPLNPDFYLTFTVSSPNTPPLSGSAGRLSTSGQAFMRFSLPPIGPALVGVEFSHAAIVGSIAASEFLISNPVLLTLTQ
jgi:hypothetical protein